MERRDAQDRAHRRGQRAEHEALQRPRRDARAAALSRRATASRRSDLARKHRPDLILMDIQLPEVSGLEVTQWLKDDEELTIDSRHRRHGVRDEGRRGEDPAGRLRGLPVEADFGRQVLRDDRPLPWSPEPTHDGSRSGRRRRPANLKLLEARLSIEYFEVLTATNGPEAIAICEKGGATSCCST